MKPSVEAVGARKEGVQFILGMVGQWFRYRSGSFSRGSLLAGGGTYRSRNAGNDDLISSTRFGLEKGLVGQSNDLGEVWCLVR